MNKVKATTMEQMLLQRVEELKMELNAAQSQAVRSINAAEDYKKQLDSYSKLFDEQDRHYKVLKAKVFLLKTMVEDSAQPNEIFDFIQHM